MNQVLTGIIAWTARVAGWAFFLTLITHVVLNHEGIGVRGQLMRLDMPSERDQAFDVLLRKAGLSHLEQSLSLSDRVHLHQANWPLGMLIPSHGRLTLNVLGLGRSGYSTMCVIFDPAGKLAGAPIDWPLPGGNIPSRYPPLILDLSDLCVAVTLEHKPRIVAASATAPARIEYFLHVYRLGFPQSQRILTIECTHAAREWLGLRPADDEQGQAGLILHSYSAGSGLLGGMEFVVVATFTWDPEKEQFIIPPPDPQGRWKIVPESEWNIPPPLEYSLLRE